MRFRIAITIAVIGAMGVLCVPAARAQQSEKRTVVSRIAPRYPDLARSMHLEGTAKLSVMVAPDGKVKSISAVGGSPILLKAAQDAVEKWKWAPAAHESTELVELHFQAE
jgi:TonB family protein